MNKPVKITIADPSELIRRGLLSILKQLDLQVHLSEVDQADQLRDTLNWQQPDILIIYPGLIGSMSLGQLRKDMHAEVKCIALQTSLSDPAALKAYDEVVSLYDSAEQIREKIVRLIGKAKPEKRSESLSQREKEVVVCVVKGMTNKQIADKLCLSTHTVITHRRNISTKLDIHSTAGLTIYAIVNQLVHLDDIQNEGSKE